MNCKHKRPDAPEGVYQYCPDCGAVRVWDRAKGDWQAWHVCEYCVLPGAK